METISKLSLKYDKILIESLVKSEIKIDIKSDSIYAINLPIKTDYKYDVISKNGKLNISGLNNEKFRFIHNPKDDQRDIKFRIKDGKKSLLINLNTGDPDEGNEYYEYLLNSSLP